MLKTTTKTTLFFIILQTVNFPDNIPLFVAAVVVCLVLFYLADIFLFKKISPLASGRKMTSEVRHILEKDWSESGVGAILDGISSLDYEHDTSAYDEQQRRNRELDDSLWAAQREREEYERVQKESDAAIRYYEENYS